MPRVIRTLWFEDIGFLREPLLDTPIGKLTLRQLAIMLAFTPPAWLAALLTNDLIGKLIAGGAVFSLGVVLALHRVKTVPPERSLMLLFAMPKPRRTRHAATRQIEVTASLETVVPIKIVGILRHPSTGKVLPSTSFDIFVDGKQHSAGITDEEGFFTTFLAPAAYGLSKVEVRAAGFTDPSEVIEVTVQPR